MMLQRSTLRHALHSVVHLPGQRVKVEPGATGVVRSVRDYVSDELNEPWRYEELRPRETIRRGSPNTLETDPPEVFERLAVHEHPAVFRVRLPGARVAGLEPIVFTDDRRALAESAFDREQLDANRAMHGRLPVTRRVRGTCAVMTNQWWSGHFHWMLDTLPRIALLPADASNRLLLSAPLGPAQRRSLELAGIAKDAVVSFHGGHVQIEDAILPSLPGRTGNPPRWALEWLRERLSPAPRRSGRRLYVSRGDVPRRRLRNEDALIEALRPLGFEVVLPGQLPLEEQLRTFAEAEFVVAPHGGALVNMLSSQEATLVEIFDPRYVNGCYYALTDALDLGYWYVVGEAAAEDDFTVRPEAVVDTLRAAGAA
jgi:hypothetical protein